MLQEDIAFVADALLALCENDARAPFTTESALFNRAKRQAQRDVPAGEFPLRIGNDELLRTECRDVFNRARLTIRQAEVLEQRLEGWTFEEIGLANGSTKQGAQRVFIQALKKLGRSLRVYPYAGLSEIYRSEVRRGLKPVTRFGRI